ncbi:PilW family protein [Candidatus Omnitrophota bacterium]
MDKKAFTVSEMLVTIMIGAFLLGVVAGTVFVGRNTWIRNSASIELQQKAHHCLEKLGMELRRSDASYASIQACINEMDDTCVGQLIRFQTPQVTDDPIAGTYFLEDPAGEIKWGADGRLNEETIYMVPRSNFSSEHQGRLVRMVKKEGVAVEFENEDDYAITVIADRVSAIGFLGYDYAGEDTQENPDYVEITVLVEKPSHIGEAFRFNLSSSVSLRN